MTAMEETAPPAAAPAAAPRPGPLARAKLFYEEHEAACTVAFFVGGFLFDALFVGRIDEVRGLIQQAVYLTLCALFTGCELRERYGDFVPPAPLRTLWRYHKAATHFMLGTLLNIYTLFYFKSASLSSSFLFLVLLAGLLAINELKPFESSGTTLRMALFSLCLVSYFTALVPTLVGSIGALPFLGTIAASSACAALIALLIRAGMTNTRDAAARHLLLPFAAVAAVFTSLYFLKVLPPVPLSLLELGVYHGVRRDGDAFVLTETRPRWRFWERGDQTFLARPGDRLFVYTSVFSPARFRERLRVQWLFKSPTEGWGEMDAIPLSISGGRDDGFRGFVSKDRFSPGRWRVRIETSDGRELGRLSLTVVDDPSTGPRDSRELPR
jgi:hypothetical protein